MKSFAFLILAVLGLFLILSTINGSRQCGGSKWDVVNRRCGEASFQRERRVSQKALEIVRSRVRRQEVPDCDDDVEPEASCSNLGSTCNYYADEAEEEAITCTCDPNTSQYNCGDEWNWSSRIYQILLTHIT